MRIGAFINKEWVIGNWEVGHWGNGAKHSPIIIEETRLRGGVGTGNGGQHFH
jgi:hypothetical protein